MGFYQCAAENTHGMLASATWVHVQGKRLWAIQWGTDTMFIFGEREGGREGGREGVREGGRGGRE